MEMGVQVTYVARATVAAHGILERASPVIDAMYQMMGEEQGKGAEDGGFVNSIQHRFKVEQ